MTGIVLLLSITTILQTASADRGTLPSPTPTKTYTHGAFADGDCGNCHELQADHKTPIPNKLKLPQPAVCYQCHDPVDKGKNLHGALSSGTCTDCHFPHQGPFKKLLRQKISVLCVECHGAPGTNQPVEHRALRFPDSCVQCHNPHSSDKPKLIRDDGFGACTYCHRDMGRKLADPAVKIHPALLTGCETCHMPHGSRNGSLLKTRTINALCFTCHQKEQYQFHPRAGHPNSGIADPIHSEREMSCISCHKPHYSKNNKLFRYWFKKGETPYDGTICSVCHWQTLIPPPGPPTPPWEE